MAMRAKVVRISVLCLIKENWTSWWKANFYISLYW